ncbi:hypothetical protein [Niallia sp. 03190]|uniref:hypothetical protein n=1 Tax=Niallia sp. 03190 TaxID=3458061 RepID=UPI0040443FDD
MDENRKKVIVKEIIYWKKSRMLPEHYCDYLLSLYTEGNQPVEETTKKTSAMSSSLFLLFIPLTVVLLYFTELSFILQIAISLIFLTFCIISMYFYKNKNSSVHIPAAVAALIVLITSTYVVLYFFSNNLLFLSIVLSINCVCWFIVGKRYKLLYFTISSVVGFVLLCWLFLMKIV